MYNDPNISRKKSHKISVNTSIRSLRSKTFDKYPKKTKLKNSINMWMLICGGLLVFFSFSYIVRLSINKGTILQQSYLFNGQSINQSKNLIIMESAPAEYTQEVNEKQSLDEQKTFKTRSASNSNLFVTRTNDFNSTVSRVLSPIIKKNHLDPRDLQISLIGERHSGTNWITSEIKRCFPSLDFKVRLVRYKHWFQDKNLYDSKKHKPTIVIAQFRNVYDWISAMREGPHHAPLHLRLDWKTFLTRPWTMPRPNRDLEILDKKGITCQEGYRYEQIISCIRGRKVSLPDPRLKIKSLTNYSGHNPQYEMMQNGTGQPYSSILDLRSDKIRNFISVSEWDWVKAFIPVQYESLVTFGTKELIDQIHGLSRVEPSCEPSRPKAWVTKVRNKEMESWLNDKVDWQAESLIGYSKRDFEL